MDEWKSRPKDNLSSVSINLMLIQVAWYGPHLSDLMLNYVIYLVFDAYDMHDRIEIIVDYTKINLNTFENSAHVLGL